jgi:hypothetical protein
MLFIDCKKPYQQFGSGEALPGTRIGLLCFHAMKDFAPLSEWSAPPMRLEDFVLTSAWQALPFSIQSAVAHIWRGEQDTVAIPADKATTSAQAARIGVTGAIETREID